MNLYSLPNDSSPDNETLAMLENNLIWIALPVVYSLVVSISVPGNIISLWILIFHTKPITSLIILMINLSITDLALAIVLPFQINYHYNGNNWIFGKDLCNVVTIMFYVNMYCTILTIMLISVERYLGVVHPMKSSVWRRKRYAVGAIISIWIVLMAAFYPMESTDLTYEVKHLNKTTCFDVLKWTMLPNIISWAAFIIVLFFILFLVPSIVTIVCYVHIIRKLIQTSNRHGTGQERRSINLAIFVLIIFITCFAPNNFILLIHTIFRLFFDKSYYHAYKLSLTLSCLSSCVDPFLYYFACKDFRKKALELWHQRFRRTKSYETRRGSMFSALTFSSGQAEALENGNNYKHECNNRESDM
ncbi:PREDICTED: P2Y purinoceptor 8 [Nanorana parkeri]|uniref:P2Y purinoceptor 8 n=1 Tax=Nanorana parkeri TaxID=125878 RepID=UPI000854DE24|nr:PREDICTED: P2Y purinoceptor 8 [Nanorana parkeri]